MNYSIIKLGLDKLEFKNFKYFKISYLIMYLLDKLL